MELTFTDRVKTKSLFLYAIAGLGFSWLDFLCFEDYFYENLIKGCEDNEYETKDNYHCWKIQLWKDHSS